ncbi:MAG: hypothetical protein PHY59_05280 [Methanobacterium sp.]|nr:hypothetical protein [Methanobacterium sp.]
MESFKRYKKNCPKEQTNYPLQAIKFMDPDIKTLDCETEELLDYEVQVTLDLFQKNQQK